LLAKKKIIPIIDITNIKLVPVPQAQPLNAKATATTAVLSQMGI